MKKLNKFQSVLFLVGGLMMVIGAGCYVFFFYQVAAAFIFLAGAVLFAMMQIQQRYEGSNITILRLRRIQLMADFLFVLSGFLMIDSQFKLLLPLFSNYETYVQYVFNKWIITILVAAVLEIYTIHRLSSELEKEKKC
jgi:hypothetical protein